MLLLTLAIVDDIIAILIIATFYSGGIAMSGLALVGGAIIVLWVIQRFAIRHNQWPSKNDLTAYKQNGGTNPE
jgi:Na+/H+ antiporter NhaA